MYQSIKITTSVDTGIQAPLDITVPFKKVKDRLLGKYDLSF